LNELERRDLVEIVEDRTTSGRSSSPPSCRSNARVPFTPFRARAAHVMQLGPVWIEQSSPLPNDRIELEQVRAGSE
jgi:hypothetical protein